MPAPRKKAADHAAYTRRLRPCARRSPDVKPANSPAGRFTIRCNGMPVYDLAPNEEGLAAAAGSSPTCEKKCFIRARMAGSPFKQNTQQSARRPLRAT